MFERRGCAVGAGGTGADRVTRRDMVVQGQSRREIALRDAVVLIHQPGVEDPLRPVAPLKVAEQPVEFGLYPVAGAEPGLAAHAVEPGFSAPDYPFISSSLEIVLKFQIMAIGMKALGNAQRRVDVVIG